jgi:hypothetical protein
MRSSFVRLFFNADYLNFAEYAKLAQSVSTKTVEACSDTAINNAIVTLVKMDKELVKRGEHPGVEVNVNVNVGVMQISLTKKYQ